MQGNLWIFYAGLATKHACPRECVADASALQHAEAGGRNADAQGRRGGARGALLILGALWTGWGRCGNRARLTASVLHYGRCGGGVASEKYNIDDVCRVRLPTNGFLIRKRKCAFDKYYFVRSAG